MIKKRERVWKYDILLLRIRNLTSEKSIHMRLKIHLTLQMLNEFNEKGKRRWL